MASFGRNHIYLCNSIELDFKVVRFVLIVSKLHFFTNMVLMFKLRVSCHDTCSTLRENNDFSFFINF